MPQLSVSSKGYTVSLRLCPILSLNAAAPFLHGMAEANRMLAQLCPRLYPHEEAGVSTPTFTLSCKLRFNSALSANGMFRNGSIDAFALSNTDVIQLQTFKSECCLRKYYLL